MYRRRRVKVLKPGKLAKRRRKALTYKTGMVVLGVLIILILVSWLLRNPAVIISEVAVKGNSVLTEAEIEGVVTEALDGTYAFLFPKRSIFLYPKDGVEAAVYESFKRVRSVDLSYESFHGIEVTVEERRPFALWCTERSDAAECYFVDADGYIFATAPDFSGPVFFTHYGPIEGEPIGAQLLTPELFKQLHAFVGALKQLELGVLPIALGTEDDAEFELYLESGSKILFGLEQSFEETLENLQSVFASEPFQAEDRLTLDYVDLRFGSKVYYKFE